MIEIDSGKWVTSSQVGNRRRTDVSSANSRSKGTYKRCLNALHSQNIGAHLGLEKTLAKFRTRFYWYGYHRDTEFFCKQCEMCAPSKPSPYTIRAPLQQDIPSFPWERIAMDIAGPLPVTDTGNRFILVMSDYFTKWPVAFA